MIDASRDAGRDLLYILLAVHNNFIGRETLATACRSRPVGEATTIGQQLRDSGKIDERTDVVLEALVDRHLSLHGGEPRASLADLGSVSSLDWGLDDLLASGAVDPLLTASWAAGLRPSDGEPATTVSRTATKGSERVRADRPAVAASGRYQILRLHARGGLGEVFVARDEELGREVALKQIQDRHADDPFSRSRFVLEAEVTGGLEHPGIVPVYGLGYNASGRPYYAMRFVRGDTFKEAIDRFHAPGGPPSGKMLEFRQLLGRFVAVCNAVAYAHSRGVIHRDLKPSNILLGPYGETLVVDWGLAKPHGRPDAETAPGSEGLIAPASAGASETIPGSALGTPAYMSPEQASGDLVRVGPSSDIYSLGATLYALLTGRAAFRGQPPAELIDAVRRGGFPAPRSVSPWVPRALEATCLKAMARDPADRYVSPRALADDIEHWLADEPVTAWREPWTARTRRWMRRRRTLVTASAAALVVAVVALGGSLARERQGNARLQAANRRAQERLELALKAVQQYHTVVNREALLAQPEWKELRASLLSSPLAFYRQLRESLRSDGATDAASRLRLARAASNLGFLTAAVGSPEDALSALEEARDLLERLARDHPADVKYRRELADILVDLGGLCRKTGRLRLAEERYQTAAGLYRRLTRRDPIRPSDRSALAGTLIELGVLHAEATRTEKAEASYHEARQIDEALLRQEPGELTVRGQLASLDLNLGSLYAHVGRQAEAETSLTAALERWREMIREAPADPRLRSSLALALNQSGNFYRTIGRGDRAEASYREALEIFQALTAERPAITQYRRNVAMVHNNLGAVHGLASRVESAEREYRAARNAVREMVRDHPTVPAYREMLAKSESNLGALYVSAGRFQEAEAAHQSALAVAQALAREYPTVPEYRNSLAVSHYNLGIMNRASGQLDRAGASYREALAIRRRLVHDYPHVVEYRVSLSQVLNNLGNIERDLGRLDRAEAYYRAGIAIKEPLAREFPDVPGYASQLASGHNNLVS